MGVSSAIHFNNGISGMRYVKAFNIEIRFYKKLFFGESDGQKQDGQNRKSNEKQKSRKVTCNKQGTYR